MRRNELWQGLFLLFFMFPEKLYGNREKRSRKKCVAQNNTLSENQQGKCRKENVGLVSPEGSTVCRLTIIDAVTELFEHIVDKNLLVRRVNIAANHVVDEAYVQKADSSEQLDLFTDYTAAQAKKEQEEAELEREKKMQQAMLEIKKKYGKNAVLKGMNLEEGATTLDRNKQIGGHKA